MYIDELSSLIKRNNLDTYTIDKFIEFLNEEETKEKYCLNDYKNTEIQLVGYKLIKNLDDYDDFIIIIITYHLVDLDDDTCQEIVSYSTEHSLKQLEILRSDDSTDLGIICTIKEKFQKWIDSRPDLELAAIEGVKETYKNWKLDDRDEYEEYMEGICIEELNYKLKNIYYYEAYYDYYVDYQDTFIIKLDISFKEKFLDSYYLEFTVDGEVLDDWMAWDLCK